MTGTALCKFGSFSELGWKCWSLVRLCVALSPRLCSLLSVTTVRRKTKSTLADNAMNSTFLKRKGGLFKKAHELSVLCSVDVAVIIFGHNKKLYEYSSGDIQETIGRFQYVRSPSSSPAVRSDVPP